MSDAESPRSAGSAKRRRRERSSDGEDIENLLSLGSHGWPSDSPATVEEEMPTSQQPEADGESVSEMDRKRTEAIINLMDGFIKEDMKSLPESMRQPSNAEIPVGCFRHENLLHIPDTIARSTEGCSRLFAIIPGELTRANLLLHGDGYPWTFVFYLTGNDFKDNIYKAIWFFVGLLKHVSKDGQLGLTCNTTNCRVMRKAGDSRAQRVVTGIEVKQAYDERSDDEDEDGPPAPPPVAPSQDTDHSDEESDGVSGFPSASGMNRRVQFGQCRNWVTLQPFDMYVGVTAALSTDDRGAKDVHKFAVLSVVPRRNVHLPSMINSYFDATEKLKDVKKLNDARMEWAWLLLHEYHNNLAMRHDPRKEPSMYVNNPCGDMGPDNVFCALWVPVKIRNLVIRVLKETKRKLANLRILHISPDIDTKDNDATKALNLHMQLLMAHRTNCLSAFMTGAQKFATFLESKKAGEQEGDTEFIVPHPGGWPLLQKPDDGSYVAMGLFPSVITMRVQDLSTDNLTGGFLFWRVSPPPRIPPWTGAPRVSSGFGMRSARCHCQPSSVVIRRNRTYLPRRFCNGSLDRPGVYPGV